MAQERVSIRIDAVDRTKKAFSSIKNNVFNLRNALAGLGVGLVVKQFVDTGRAVENLSVRFKFLFGSAEQGTKAFDNLVRFAAKVPFSLEEISSASGNLAVVSKDADDLAKVLEVTGNVAAVTGLDFQTTASQIQRSFAGGIASADVFREKGVRSLLGFSAGASASAEETRKRFEEVFGKGGKFGQATAELARTFDGALSMLGDKLFKFKKDVSDSEFFMAFKQEIGALDKFLVDNEKMFQRFAKNLGESLGKAVNSLGNGIRFVNENLTIFIEGARILVGFALAAIMVSAANAFISLAVSIGGATTAMLAFNSATKKNLLFAGGALLISQFDKIYGKIKELLNIAPPEMQLYDPDEIEGGAISLDFLNKKFEEQLGFIQSIKRGLKDVFESINAATVGKGVVDILKKDFENINASVSKGIAKGIKSMSKGLAESIILGKDLTNTFRELAQQILVTIIAKTIEFLALKAIEYFWNKLIKKQTDDKLNTERKISSEKRKQVAYQAIITALGGGGGGFNPFGSAEGGRVNGTRANGGQTQNGNAYMVGERGRELFIPSTDGQIVSNENLNGMGATNINFTVQATDVKGVQELLIDNRATITNIINTALNQKGKPALV